MAAPGTPTARLAAPPARHLHMMSDQNVKHIAVEHACCRGYPLLVASLASICPAPAPAPARRRNVLLHAAAFLVAAALLVVGVCTQWGVSTMVRSLGTGKVELFRWMVSGSSPCPGTWSLDPHLVVCPAPQDLKELSKRMGPGDTHADRACRRPCRAKAGWTRVGASVRAGEAHIVTSHDTLGWMGLTAFPVAEPLLRSTVPPVPPCSTSSASGRRSGWRRAWPTTGCSFTLRRLSSCGWCWVGQQWGRALCARCQRH